MKTRLTKPCRSVRIRGFSLLEIVVAIAMFVVVVVALLGLFVNGYLNVRQMRMSAKASFYAQQLMEEWNNVSRVFLPAGGTAANVSDGDLSDGNFNYSLTFEADPGSLGGGYPNIVEINATVYWQGRTQQRSYSLVTYLANID